jgi:hypothetical protein
MNRRSKVTEEYGHISDAFDMLPEEELLMTEDIQQPNGDFLKNPDEIVLENVRLFHYETMEEGRHVWIGIYGNDGKIYHMNISGDNLKVYYSDESS